MKNMDSWKTKTLIFGAILGAVAGAVAAYIFAQKSDQMEDRPRLTAGDGVKVGLGVLAVLRQIAEMGGR